MVRDDNPTSRRARIVIGVAALLATAGVLGLVLGLDVHYDREFLRVPKAQAMQQQLAVHHGAAAFSG